MILCHRDGDRSYGAAQDLLLREPVLRSRETALDDALRVARRVDFGVLPVQAPAGFGI